jgi:CBS domain-containing protein
MSKDSVRVRAALLDPASVFGSPAEVERDGTLSQEEKLAILGSWEEDAHELAVAEDENMGGGGPSRLEEVMAARARLTGAAEQASAAPRKGAASGTLVRRFACPVREVIHADHEMDEAALRLSLQEHPVLPVVDADQIVGVLARAELARAAEEQNRDVRITARVMMTTDLAFCYLDDDVATARALMDRHGCNHLMVVDRDQVLVGTLERDDLPAADPGDAGSRQERPEVVEPREEHAQGVASTIQPSGLDVYDERPTIKAPHG